jgi:hypothetical protein
MGFRDFHSIDLAMLAKQIWRLITDQDSLCLKVLKEKYYPHCEFLSAGPKVGSSFTWHRIVTAIPTFKSGYIWRVGSGEKIISILIHGFLLVQTGCLSLQGFWGF